MAPKRKAAEPVNSEQTSVERSKGIATDDKNPPGTLCRQRAEDQINSCRQCPDSLHKHILPLPVLSFVAINSICTGTLAGASGQSVNTLLGRVGNKRLKARAAKVNAQCFSLCPSVIAMPIQVSLPRFHCSHAWSCTLQGLKASSSAAFSLPKRRTAAEAVCGAPSQVSAAAAEQKVAQQEDQNDVDVASGSDWEVRLHALHCIALRCIALHCIALHCIASYRIVSH